MSYHDDAITDHLPFCEMEVPWTAEDLFPIPPTIQLLDSSAGQPVSFRVVGRASKGTHQFALIHNAEIDLGAIVEINEDGETEIVRDHDKALEIEQWIYRADQERDDFGEAVREKFCPIVLDDEGCDYRVQFAATLNYQGGVYQVMAPGGNAESLLICRLQYDEFGCEDILQPVTDEKMVRDLYKQYFKMLDDIREQAHGEQTYSAFNDSDDGLFE